MKKQLVACLIFIFSCVNILAQGVLKIDTNVKKILFIGDSITYQAFYVNYFITYSKLNTSNIAYEFFNLGLPSETVSKLSEPGHAKGKFPRPKLQQRLKRTLKTIQPDLVFICYGINDGIYMPFDNTRFKKFQKGIEYTHRVITKSEAQIIHITPTIYDAQQGEAYANVMDIYSDWLLSKQYTSNWNVIDIHTPMKRSLYTKRLTDKDFMHTHDGIHPKPKGHWVMATEIIKHLYPNQPPKTEDATSYFSLFKNGEAIFKLTQEKQKILTDAWLTHIGHKRPNMKKGLPLDQANSKAKILENKIKKLLH